MAAAASHREGTRRVWHMGARALFAALCFAGVARAAEDCLELCPPAEDAALCLEKVVHLDECPEDPNVHHCATAGLAVGDICEADGECGTDKKLDNCPHLGVFAADVYKVVSAASPSPRPTSCPTASSSSPPPTATAAPTSAKKKKKSSRCALALRVLLVIFFFAFAGIIICYLLYCVGLLKRRLHDRDKRKGAEMAPQSAENLYVDDLPPGPPMPPSSADEAPVGAPHAAAERAFARSPLIQRIAFEDL